MRSLLNFIVKYHYLLLFILIECFSIMLAIQYNDYQRASFLNSSSNISGKVYKKFYSVSQYLNLKKTNEELNETLASLRNESLLSYKNIQVKPVTIHDSIYIQQYQYIPTQVINNSINKQNNYITLNAGKKQGIDKGMGVISPVGVVGVVKDVSDNFASVISLLNQHLKISAMIKHSGYFGSLYWDGDNYQYAVMVDLPSHITVTKGDTIITSGYSTMFPKGEIIGFVESVNESEGSDLLTLTVLLSVDFNKLSHVLVVKNLLKNEQLQLETKLSHD